MNKINWNKLEIGLKKYQSIMKLYKQSVKISTSEVFKNEYMKFYGMNRGKKSIEFQKLYFKILDQAKVKQDLEFKFVLESLFKIGGKKEFSFTSKLLATANPNLPVWDSKVRKFINHKYKTNFTDYYGDINSCVEKYNKFNSWFKYFLKTEQAIKLLLEFDKKIPNSKITKMKKIDLMFWQMEY